MARTPEACRPSGGGLGFDNSTSLFEDVRHPREVADPSILRWIVGVGPRTKDVKGADRQRPTTDNSLLPNSIRGRGAEDAEEPRAATATAPSATAGAVQ